MPAGSPLSKFRDTAHKSVAALGPLLLVGVMALPACTEDRPLPTPPSGDGSAPDAPQHADGNGNVPSGDAAAALDSAAPDAAGVPPVVDREQQCRVNTDRTAPFPVTFRLVNRGDKTVYLHHGCAGVYFSLASCGSRYINHAASPEHTCGCPCEDPSCTGAPIDCSPCPPNVSVALAPGESRDVPWDGVKVTTEDRGASGCVRRTPVPAARYAVYVPVFDAPAKAMSATPYAHLASTAFDLPAARGIVEIPVEAPKRPTTPACETAWQGEEPICAQPFSPVVPCHFDTEYTFGLENDGKSGLTWSERTYLRPPSQYVRVRTFTTPEPALECKNHVPRCGASHDTFSTADVMEALAAPDVVAAFAQPQPLVYGYDSRIDGNQVWFIKRADGHGLIIGGRRCSSTRPCDRMITTGIGTLSAVLDRLETQQLRAPGCEALRRD